MNTKHIYWNEVFTGRALRDLQWRQLDEHSVHGKLVDTIP